MDIFTHPDFDGHEQVVFSQNDRHGLKSIIAIHDTTLGPALGGCRIWKYQTEGAALSDVLRLSRGMSYKAALTGLALGGGKGDGKDNQFENLHLITLFVFASLASTI